jgi:hypothetical protein
VSFISLEHVRKVYRTGEVVTEALRAVSFEIGMVESLKTNE